ncbi:MAG: ribonuclease III [Maricaulaceae bacterium]
MTDQIDALQIRIGQRFADPDLLARALTHASWGEGRRASPHNERLEFLGDRVLGLLAAERLYREDPDAKEGDLARRLNSLVRKETCARAAQRAGLGEALRLSKSEVKTGGRDKPSILADACEAVIAALYLDGGLEAARGFFERFWAEEFAQEAVGKKDPKTRLQEWAQARGLEPPRYAVLARSGPDHAPVFVIGVSVEGFASAQGEGGAKQDAERAAAWTFLSREQAL